MAKKNQSSKTTNQPTPAEALEQYRQFVIDAANTPEQPVDNDRLAELLYATGRTMAHFLADQKRYLGRRRAVEATTKHAQAKAALPALKAKHDRMQQEFQPVRAKLHAEYMEKLRAAGQDLDAVAAEMLQLQQSIDGAAADMRDGGPVDPAWVAHIRRLGNELNGLLTRQSDLRAAAGAADGLRESLASFRGLRFGQSPPPWHPVRNWTDPERIRDAYTRGVLSEDERAAALKFINEAEAKANKAAEALTDFPGWIAEKEEEIAQARRDSMTPENFSLCEGPGEVPGLGQDEEEAMARLNEKYADQDKTLRGGGGNGDAAYADDLADLREVKAGVGVG